MRSNFSQKCAAKHALVSMKQPLTMAIRVLNIAFRFERDAERPQSVRRWHRQRSPKSGCPHPIIPVTSSPPLEMGDSHSWDWRDRWMSHDARKIDGELFTRHVTSRHARLYIAAKRVLLDPPGHVNMTYQTSASENDAAHRCNMNVFSAVMRRSSTYSRCLSVLSIGHIPFSVDA